MEKGISKLEEREELTPSDGRKIRCLKEMATEEAPAFNEHVDRVRGFIK